MTTPTQDWWLIIRCDGVPHCWQVGDTSDEAHVRDLIDRARVVVGFPGGDGWVGDPHNSVQLSCGRPHERLMAQATAHQLSDLDTVTVEALATYRAQCDAEAGRARMQAAREAMARLTPAERDQVIREVAPRPAGGLR